MCVRQPLRDVDVLSPSNQERAAQQQKSSTTCSLCQRQVSQTSFKVNIRLSLQLALFQEVMSDLTPEVISITGLAKASNAAVCLTEAK